MSPDFLWISFFYGFTIEKLSGFYKYIEYSYTLISNPKWKSSNHWIADLLQISKGFFSGYLDNMWKFFLKKKRTFKAKIFFFSFFSVMNNNTLIQIFGSFSKGRSDLNQCSRRLIMIIRKNICCILPVVNLNLGVQKICIIINISLTNIVNV